MTSYFEISGFIVESDNNTSLPSSKFGGIAAERPERGRNSAKAEEVTTRVDHSVDSLYSHWVKTSFHPAREFAALPRSRQIGYLNRPHLFAIWGIGKLLEVIIMHDQYLSDYVDTKTDRFH